MQIFCELIWCLLNRIDFSWIITIYIESADCCYGINMFYYRTYKISLEPIGFQRKYFNWIWIYHTICKIPIKSNWFYENLYEPIQTEPIPFKWFWFHKSIIDCITNTNSMQIHWIPWKSCWFHSNHTDFYKQILPIQ